MPETSAVKNYLTSAQDHLRQGNHAVALEILREACQAFPGNHDVYLNIAMANRMAGNVAKAIWALDEALALEPYSFLALLSKGSILEQTGRIKRATLLYKNALTIVPRANDLPQGLQDQILHAEKIVKEQAIAQADFLRQTLGPLDANEPGEHKKRFEESINIASGITSAYPAAPLQLHYPRLPAIPFFDRKYFPWIKGLESATTAIAEELLRVTDDDQLPWAPYVQYSPGTPENQFADLNHSNDWSSIWLWRDGDKQDVAKAFPATLGALANIPLADQPSFAPTVVFSALAPKTTIPPHTGSTNARLLVHLPLVLPGPAFFRVGNERRKWQLGTAWVFDDTIEHEAQNEADEIRIILIFDIWNPLLSAAEREKIRQLLLSQRAWLDED